MQPAWILVFCVCTVTAMFSQSVTIETRPVTVKYGRLPDKPLDPSWTSYHMQADVVSDEYPGVTPAIREWIFQQVRLAGYPMKASDGEIRLQLRVGPMTIPAETLKSRKTNTIDKDGREHVSHEFYYEVKYVVPFSCAVAGADGEVLNEIGIYNLTDDLVYKTGYYKQDRELDAWWRSHKNNIMSGLKLERVRDGLTRLQERLNSEHGFTPMEEQVRFETIGKKKHPEANAFDTALGQLSSALAIMQVDEPLNRVRQLAEEPLSFYKDRLDGLDAGDKDQSRLRHICLFNLATAYYWLEDFEASENYIRMLLEMDPDDKDALKLSESIRALKAELQKAGRSSRHGGIRT